MSLFTALGTITVSAATEASGKRDLDWDGTYWYSDTKVSTYTSGTGTADDPYIVTTAAQLRHLARGNGAGGGKYYKLGNDIVLNDTSAEDWYEQDGLTNWIKGTDSTYGVFSEARNKRELGGELFRDTFDGDGHTISGLYIDYNGTGKMADRTIANWALFPAVNGATFKNLKLKDVYIKSNISSSNNEWHGYGALIGSTYYGGATVTNVEIENVKFDISRPNQGTGNTARVCVGGIIGYAAGNITATDCIVRNVFANIGNYYFTSRMYGHAGSLLGFVVDGYKHTLTNVISIGGMNPLPVQAANSAIVIQSGNYSSNMPLRANSSATNVWAIGAGTILSGSNINLSADTTTFLNDNLGTFYSGLGGSTNWAAQQAGVLPSLSDFPYVEEHKTPAAVLHEDFSSYNPSTTAKALTNWTVVSDTGNQVLKGDFTDTSLTANNFGFIVGSYAYGVHGPLEPGKIYKLDFKAKADENAAMDYALYNGSTYAASSRDYHVVSGGYDEFGRRTANLTTEWQEFSTYFTFDSYTNTGDQWQGVKRPFFFIQPNNDVWGNEIYFDDMVLTPYDGMSFCESDNHYYEPTLGEIGDDITLPTPPVREGYVFEGWYTDAGLTVALDTANTKVGDIDVVYANWSVDLKGVSVDFENGSYTVGGANALNTSWSVVDDGGNAVLKRTKDTSYAANSFGFMIGNYTGSSENTPLEAGKAYQITFKAKADLATQLDYAVFSGYSYAYSNYTRDRFQTKDASTGAEVTLSPSVGNRVSLTTSWQEFSTVFTVEEYEIWGGTYTRPHFYITDPIWNSNLYFDDFELTQCDSAVNFNLYDNKFAKPFVAASGTTITMPAAPERADYIFEGWYSDSARTSAFTDTTVSAGNTTAYAKWTAAVRELNCGNVSGGTRDLEIKVTNANAYPVKFRLETNGSVTVSIFTASDSNPATAKSVVWTRTLSYSGNVGALINPAVIKEGGVTGDELYVTVTPASGVTATLIGFEINGITAPTRRIFEGDINGDDAFNIKDLVSLKKMAFNFENVTWMGDIDGNDYIAEVFDLTKTRNWLLTGSKGDVDTTKNGRTLVWHDEFDGGKLNANNFRYLDANRSNSVTYASVDSLNYYDGKLNLKVGNLDGTNYKVPCMLTSLGKMTYNKGYLEVRAKINAVPGQWAGFWLASETDQYSDYCGEIDIVETTSASRYQNNIHSWKNDIASHVTDSYKSNYVYADHDFNKTEYHIFGFEWDDTYITYYVDDVQYARYSISDIRNVSAGTVSPKYPFDGIFNQYYAVRLDNTIYSAALSPDGAMPEFNIDYVRLYQKSGETYKINGVLQ